MKHQLILRHIVVDGSSAVKVARVDESGPPEDKQIGMYALTVRKCNSIEEFVKYLPSNDNDDMIWDTARSLEGACYGDEKCVLIQYKEITKMFTPHELMYPDRYPYKEFIPT